MEVVYYQKQTKYIVDNCTEDDIELHYAIVESMVNDMDKDIYVAKMLISVAQGRAYKVTKDTGLVAFIYIHTENNWWYGNSIYGSDIVGSMLMFKEIVDRNGHMYLLFAPHSNGVRHIKSICTGRSLRFYYTNGENYVQVRTKNIMPKFQRLYEKLGITQ